MKDRFAIINKKRKLRQVLYKAVNQDSDYGFDIFDANEDFDWMLYEIDRLQKENQQLQEFITELKQQLMEELNIMHTNSLDDY